MTNQDNNHGDAELERLDRAAEHVRLSFKGVRVSVSGLPSRRAVSAGDAARVANLFDADVASVSMSSNLWDAKEPAVKRLRATISAVHRLFHDRRLTRPTVMPGIRVIRKDSLVEFDQSMRTLADDLRSAAAALEAELPAISQRESLRRGRLFSLQDYAFSPVAAISVSWSFPSIMEDQELVEIDASVYQREVSRVREELRAAGRLAEQQMAKSLHDALSAVCERLTSEGGERKTFRNSTVTKLFEELDFIQTELTETGLGGDVMASACSGLRKLLAGQDRESLGEALRDHAAYRQQVADGCRQIAETLLAGASPVKRRAIIRPAARQEEAHAV